MHTVYDFTGCHGQTKHQQAKLCIFSGRLCAQELRMSLCGATLNQVTWLLLEPLPIRLDRRRASCSGQSADGDTDGPRDQPFARASPQR
jgi:hypothetical protein